MIGFFPPRARLTLKLFPCVFGHCSFLVVRPVLPSLVSLLILSIFYWTIPSTFVPPAVPRSRCSAKVLVPRPRGPGQRGLLRFFLSGAVAGSSFRLAGHVIVRASLSFRPPPILFAPEFFCIHLFDRVTGALFSCVDSLLDASENTGSLDSFFSWELLFALDLFPRFDSLAHLFLLLFI